MPSLSNYALLAAAHGSGTRYNPSRPGTFQWDILKRAYVVPQTGALYTGPLGTGNYSINGQHSATPPPGTSDPNLPQVDVTHTVRQPAIAALTDALTRQTSQQATSTGNDLAASLPALQDIATRSYTRSQGATDTVPLEAQLTGSMTAQEKAQRGLATEQGQRNKDFAAETEAMLSRLSAENANWEARTNAIGERAGAAAITNANLIPLASGGNPTVRSGAQPSRVAVALANALLPTEQAISARRYAQVANIEQPWRQGLYAQDSALIASNQALESSFGGNWRAIYQYIQGVKQQAAQMDATNAERFIAQSLALKRVPAEFLSNQISMAAALQRLDDAATEHLVSQNVDTGQFVGGPAFSAPGIDRSYRPGTPNPNVMPRGNAQDGTGPNARGWQDWNQLWNTPAQASRAAQDYIYTPEGLQDYYDAYGSYPPARQYASVAAPTPFTPNRVSGGWGYVNGQYIGADADAWNENFYGPVVSPYE